MRSAAHLTLQSEKNCQGTPMNWHYISGIVHQLRCTLQCRNPFGHKSLQPTNNMTVTNPDSNFLSSHPAGHAFPTKLAVRKGYRLPVVTEQQTYWRHSEQADERKTASPRRYDETNPQRMIHPRKKVWSALFESGVQLFVCELAVATRAPLLTLSKSLATILEEIQMQQTRILHQSPKTHLQSKSLRQKFMNSKRANGVETS